MIIRVCPGEGLRCVNEFIVVLYNVFCGLTALAVHTSMSTCPNKAVDPAPHPAMAAPRSSARGAFRLPLSTIVYTDSARRGLAETPLYYDCGKFLTKENLCASGGRGSFHPSPDH